MNARFGSGMPDDVRLARAVVPSCPTCHNTFPAGTDVCPRDGATLMTTGAATEAGLVMAATVPGVPTPPPSPSSPSSSSPVAATAPAPQEESRFDPLVGAVLADRYQIVRRIGEGGMGAVYEAKHTVIGKRVAVKVLLEKFLAKSDFVARLLQEARLASSIGHEHIVDVTDFGTTVDGRSFVVMEFLDGESLAELAMREAPLPIERSLGIAPPGGERARRRAREGDLPPRRQTRERLPGQTRRRRLRQGRRLRHLEGGASPAATKAARATG